MRFKTRHWLMFFTIELVLICLSLTRILTDLFMILFIALAFTAIVIRGNPLEREKDRQDCLNTPIKNIQDDPWHSSVTRLKR